jgi:hypothetical protein
LMSRSSAVRLYTPMRIVSSSCSTWAWGGCKMNEA